VLQRNTFMSLLQCPVCTDTYRDPHLLGGCGHSFCRHCIASLRPKQCPTCQRAFTGTNISPNYALRAILDDSQSRQRQCAQDEFQDAVENMRRQPSGASECLARDAPKDSSTLTRRLALLGVPFGLARLIGDEDQQTALRIFLLDNSGSTSACDGKFVEESRAGTTGSGRAVSCFRPCTRWEEVCRMAMDQARWNAELQTPCEFVLLNPLASGGVLEEGVDFQRVDPSRGGVEEQLETLGLMLRRTGPRGVTPIADRLRKIRARVSADGLQLARRLQKVIVVIVTDGLPTSQQSSRSGSQERQELVQELRRMALELPTHLVVRLCTEDDSVVSFYNRVDEELELQIEVIDDMRSEAREVSRVGNDWLVYSPLVHKIREGGTFMKLFDLIDERRLEPMEVAVFCQLLLRQGSEEHFPSEPHEFCRAVRRSLAVAPPVLDPLSGQMGPPLHIDKLELAILFRQSPRRFLPKGLRQLPMFQLVMLVLACVVLAAAVVWR